MPTPLRRPTHSSTSGCPARAALAALLTTLLLGQAPANAQEDAQALALSSSRDRYEVWADVLFGPDGRNLAFNLPQESELPTPFAELVKRQLQAARITARQDKDGSPATFRTGVRLVYQLLPAATEGEASQVKFLGLNLAPLPVKRYLASYPKDIRRSAGWEGGVQARCQVSIEGLCHKVDVDMLPGMPASVRRFAKASFEGWAFDAQRINDRPIEGEFSVRFALRTEDTLPTNFRIPAFERYIRER